MRISSGMLLLTPLFAAALFAQAPQPHAGWELVPGGEDLISDGYWDTTEMVTAPATVQVSNGVLTASTGSNYSGSANPLAPRLYTTAGNFGIVATIQTSPGMSGLITLTGSLTTTAQGGQGVTTVQFGIDNNGSYAFGYWDGTSSSPNLFQFFKEFSTPPTGTMTMELLHQGGQFLLYFNGVEYGPIADPGLFALGYVMPGYELDPNQTMTLTQLAFEVPSGDTVAQLQTPVGVIPHGHPGPSLGSLAAATGRTFGVQTDAEELALGRDLYGSYTPLDPTFAPKVIGEFNLLVDNGMYYLPTESAQGDFTLDDGNAALADAKDNGLAAHCHHLIGPNTYLPSWLVNGNFTADQLTQIMKTHIQTVMGHFKGQCSSWDVVNEALNFDGTVDTSMDNVWANTIGPSYIDLAFQTARQADPAAKLFFNDWYIEDQTPKTAGLYTLLAGMQQRGTPIDGLGLESHFGPPGASDPNLLPNYDSMVANMAQLAKMGLRARISELDVRLLLPASAADLANQATVFSTAVQACLDSPNCIGISVWGADDAESWIPNAEPGYGAATLFDANFQPKPAYTAVMDTLREAAFRLHDRSCKTLRCP